MSASERGGASPCVRTRGALGAALLFAALWLASGRTARAQSDDMRAHTADRLAREQRAEHAAEHAAELQRAGRHADAVAAYRALLPRRPDDAETHVALARSLLALRLHAEAVEHLVRAVELEPERGDYRWRLGRACERAGWRACALRQYTWLLRRAPDPEAEARVRALGEDPYSHPYPFAPDAVHATELPPWQRSGPSFSLGGGSQYAGLGVQAAYQWAPAPGELALIPYASAGVLLGSDGVRTLPAWSGGVIGSYGGSYRWLIALGYGAWGRVALRLYGRIVGERALYGAHLDAGGQWTDRGGLFFRWSIGALLLTNGVDASVKPSLSLGVGFAP